MDKTPKPPPPTTYAKNVIKVVEPQIIHEKICGLVAPLLMAKNIRNICQKS
jgi:hypothetical protein